jgi:hypothetical protein
MKKYLHISVLMLCLVLIATTNNSCKKGEKQAITLDKAAGKWSINAIRMEVYYGGILSKDSTVPWRPVIENYVSFDGVSQMAYCFNQYAANEGRYQLNGGDSINMEVGIEKSRWRILLLTTTNFNIKTTSYDNHNFPGATVVTYQSYVR